MPSYIASTVKGKSALPNYQITLLIGMHALSPLLHKEIIKLLKALMPHVGRSNGWL